jgi:hypothetical protein
MFHSKEVIDFDEIFSLVEKMTSIRMIIVLIANLDLEIA